MTNDEFWQYMPDSYNEKTPERRFLLGILGTLYPDKLKNLVEEANTNRCARQAETDDDLIEITPELKLEIDGILVGKGNQSKYNYISDIVTRGRAFQLLKKGAKLDKRRSDPRRYNANLEKFDEDHEEEKKEEMNTDE